MRQILFRGKRVDTGEWEIGYVSWDRHFDGKKYIIVWFIESNEVSKKEIIPETIGQFTGIVDKNGIRVFDGDKIEEGEVFWSDDYLGWFVKGDFAEGENKPLYDIPLIQVIN